MTEDKTNIVMSYLDKLSSENKALLTIENIGVSGLLGQTKKDFPIQDFNLKVENKIFLSISDFTGKFTFGIEFKNCYFLNTVAFCDFSVSKITFNNCFFDKDVKVLRNIEVERLDLIVASIKGQLEVHDCKIQEGKWSIIDNSRVIINGGIFGNLNIGYWGGCILKELSFHFPKVHGLISVTSEKTKIERLDLFQYSLDLSIAIEDIAVNSISIYRYRNEKSLRFSNLKTFETDKESEFSIVESYLGNAEFYSIDFTRFKSLKILDAFLVNCIFVNVSFSKNIFSLKGRYVSKNAEEEKLTVKVLEFEKDNWLIRRKKGIYWDKKIANYYQKKRETLRQIKYALSKQGDVVNEKRFHSLEMRAHDRSLTWGTNFWTKIVIRFSSWTSDFGQSLLKPILFLLIGHFIFFSVLLFSSQLMPLHISFQNPTTKGFWDTVHEYLILINPLRKTDDTFSGGFILIDLAMRIWSSYMIYNIIRASRRFIK